MSIISEGIPDFDIEALGSSATLSGKIQAIRAQEYSLSQCFPKDTCAPVNTEHHYMLDLLDMHKEIERVVSETVSLFKLQSEADLKELERLEAEKQIVFRKYAEEAVAKNNWSLVANISQYLAATTSIALGASLLSTAFWAGALIASSGVVGLAGRVINETKAWNTVAAWFTKSIEYQQTIAKACEATFLGIELGIGLAGGSMAYSAGAFSIAAANRKTLANTTAASTIRLAGQGLRTISDLGRGFTEDRMGRLQGRMQHLNALEEEKRISMNREATNARNFIETAQDVGREMHQTISAIGIQS